MFAFDITFIAFLVAKVLLIVASSQSLMGETPVPREISN